MRWPGEENPTPTSNGGLTPPGTGDGALLPVRGLSAARLGADDVVPLWERLDGTRLIAGVAGPGPSSAEATDPIRATRRAGRVLESLRARLENAAAPVGESSQPGFVAITVDSDDRDPLSILGSEVQLAAAVLDRGDPSGGRVRLFWNGDSRVFFLDAVALCRLTFEDAPSPGLPGPSAVWLRTVDVRPPTTGLIITCTHGAHGYFHAPWLLERALVASLERATSWRGFAEQVRFALERETKSGASFSAFPWGASDFGVLRQAILGPGGQRLSDLAARQASAGGAGWLNAWLSLYGPIHERWRFTLHSSVRALAETIDRTATPMAAHRPPPIDAPTAAANVEVETDSPREDDAPGDYAQPLEPGAGDPAASGGAPANATDRPPNWGGVADALNRLSAEWARAARSDRPEPKAEPRPKGAVVPLRVVSGGARREEPWAATAVDNRRDGLGRALAANLLPDMREAAPETSPSAFGDSEPTDPAVEGLSAESFERADDAAFLELDAETLTSDAFELVDLVEGESPPQFDDIPPLPDQASVLPRTDAASPQPPRSPRTTAPQITSPLVSSPFSTSASRIRQAVASPSILEAAVPAAPPEFDVPDVVDGTELIEAGDDDIEHDASFPVEHESLEIVPNADDSMAVVLQSPIFEAEPAPTPTPNDSPRDRRWPLRIAALVGLVALVALYSFWPGDEDDLSSDSPAVASPIEPAPPSAAAAVPVPARSGDSATRVADRRAPELTFTSPAMPMATEAATEVPLQAELATARADDGETPTRSRYDIELATQAPGLAPLFAAPDVLPPPVVAEALVVAPPTLAPPELGGVDGASAPETAPPSLPTLDSLEAEARVHLVLRRGPGVNFPRSGLLVPGTRVQATARKDGTNWVRVLVRGRPMWANFRRDRLVPTTPGEFRQLAVIP